MTVDPNKYREYLELPNQYVPNFCFRKWSCTEPVSKGVVCYRSMRFKEVVDQLDEKTKDKMVAASSLFCPQQYVDLVNRCLYGRLSEREGCPKNLGNPYSHSNGEHGARKV